MPTTLCQAGEAIRKDIRATTIFRKEAVEGAWCITTPIASRA
jgi:hypothetical protein